MHTPTPEQLAERLRAMTRDELASLLIALCEADAALAARVGERLDAALRDDARSVNVWRARVKRMLGGADTLDAARELDELFARAAALAEVDMSASAALRGGLALGLVDGIAAFEGDDDGPLIERAERAVVQLVESFAALPPGAAREEGFVAIKRLIERDQEGGLGLLDLIAPLLPGALDEAEGGALFEWTVALLRDVELKGRSSDWDWRALMELALALGADRLDDEELVRWSVEAGMHQSAAEHLLRMGRHDEAVAQLAAHATDATIPQHLATLRIVPGGGDLALVYLRTLIAQSEPGAWLARVARERLIDLLGELGRPAEALDAAMRWLELDADEDAFVRVHQAAWAAGQWDLVGDEVIALLKKRNPGVLLCWFLDCDLPERAIALWRAVSGKRLTQQNRQFWLDAELELAEAIEGAYPELAADIYVQRAAALLDSGPEAQLQVIKLLRRLRAIHATRADTISWPDYLNETLAAHPLLKRLVPHLRD